METTFRDIRYGFRNLLKRPGFTAIALIALALDRPAACARLLAAAAAIGGEQWIATVGPAKRLPYDEILTQTQASLLPALFQTE